MTVTDFFIRVKESETDEIGFIYRGVTGVIPPAGYTAIRNLHCTRSAIEIVPTDDIRQISFAQYESIEDRIVDGDDPSDVIERVIADVIKTPSDKFREALANFQDAACKLTEAWERLGVDDAEAVGANDNYPFEHSFDEMVAKITVWGTK